MIFNRIYIILNNLKYLIKKNNNKNIKKSVYMEEDYNKKLYIGKFISFFIQNPKNTTKLRNDKKYSVKIREAPLKD